MTAAPQKVATPHRKQLAPVTPLSDSTIEIVKSSVPTLKEQGTLVILKFYETLFKRYPHFKHQFNMDRHRHNPSDPSSVPAQVIGLGNMVLSYAQHIDDLESLSLTLERVAHKHVSRAVKAEQYDAIGECLIFAMQDILGDAATPEFTEAWTEAYGLLAEIFKRMEKDLDEELSAKAGYTGFTRMHVSKVEDLEGERHLCLVPDDVPVPPHTKGQYVAVVVEDIDGEEMMATLQINGGGQDAICVTVRSSKEAASSYLMKHTDVGSSLRVSVPCGKVRGNVPV